MLHSQIDPENDDDHIDIDIELDSVDNELDYSMEKRLISIDVREYIKNHDGFKQRT